MMRAACFGLGLALLAGAPAPAARGEDPPARFERPIIIRLEGEINPRLEQYFARKLDEARNLEADLVILEIDSGGGYVGSSFNIAAAMRDLEWARTAAFIPDKAISGAAIVALGCSDIIMAPAARLGNAGPIYEGEYRQFEHVPQKIRTELALAIRDLADAHGRPAALAEAMVDKDLEVFEVQNAHTGQTWFMSDAEIRAADNPADWQKVKPILESRAENFLHLNGTRAVELKMAQGESRNREELKKHFGITQNVRVLEPTAVDTAVYALNLPLVTGLLFVIGLVALYVEFSSPGIGIGGALSALCFALFFWSRFLGGTAGWLEVLLFLAGLGFLGLELFVIPGFGVTGVTGILLLLAAVLMASQQHIIPQSPRDLQGLGTSALVLGTSVIIFAVSAVWLSRYYQSLPILNRLVLAPPMPDVDTRPATEKPDDNAAAPLLKKKTPPAAVPFPVQVGDWGVAESPLRPAGKATFADEYVDVVADGSFVEKGRQVRVVQISGNRVVVREIDDD